MNVSTLVGFLVSIGIFVASVVLTFSDATVILDTKALLIVLGGSLAATLTSFPFGQLVTLLGVFFRRVLGSNKKDYTAVVEEIVALSKAKRTGMAQFERTAQSTKHPFLREGADMLTWGESEVSVEDVRDLLETRANTHYSEYSRQAGFFRTIAKFPPAFGMIGTTLGMIALLERLGDQGGTQFIGQAMAVALITTLYGLSIANFAVIPIAENLQLESDKDYLIRRMIVEGLTLIYEGKPTKFVEEKVRSFLLPSMGRKR